MSAIGPKRTLLIAAGFATHTSAFDPKRTFVQTGAAMRGTIEEARAFALRLWAYLARSVVGSVRWRNSSICAMPNVGGLCELKK